MEDDQKKKVKVAIIVVCLVVAAVVGLTQMGEDEAEIPAFEGMEVWVLCRNPSCEAEYPVPKKDYHEYVQANADPHLPTAPPMKCEKCSEMSVFAGIRCAKCELVFEKAAIFDVTGDRGDYPDRCPKCRYSQREVDRGVIYKPKR